MKNSVKTNFQLKMPTKTKQQWWLRWLVVAAALWNSDLRNSKQLPNLIVTAYIHTHQKQCMDTDMVCINL